MKNMKFLVALALITGMSACSSTMPADPAKDSFFDNYTYYNDGIKLPTQTAKAASFFPR